MQIFLNSEYIVDTNFSAMYYMMLFKYFKNISHYSDRFFTTVHLNENKISLNKGSIMN